MWFANISSVVLLIYLMCDRAKINDQFMNLSLCHISSARFIRRNYVLKAIATFFLCFVLFCFVRSRKSMEHTKRCAFARKTSIIIIIFVLALRKRTKLSITSVKLIEIIDVLMCRLFLDSPISLCRHISIIVIHNFTRLISVNTISVCSTEILN